MNNRYLIRAAKYFVYLCVLFVLLYTILILVGYSSFQTLFAVVETDRIWMLIAVFIILPLLYPFFGFVTREARANIVNNRDAILRTMEVNQFELIEDNKDRMVFRAATFAGKLRLLYEDTIVISSDENFIKIEGPRKDVVKTEFRLKTFM